MLEASLHRRRHTVLDVSCRVRLSGYFLYLFVYLVYDFILLIINQSVSLVNGLL